MLADACCRQPLQLTLAQLPYDFEDDHFARLLEYFIYIYMYDVQRVVTYVPTRVWGLISADVQTLFLFCPEPPDISKVRVLVTTKGMFTND